MKLQNAEGAKIASLVKLGLNVDGKYWIRCKEFYLNLVNLEDRIKTYAEAKGKFPEVEVWTPCYLNEAERRKPREAHIEIARTDGYFDSIYFEIGQEELLKTVHSTLTKLYPPTEITPLEKFQASF